LTQGKVLNKVSNPRRKNYVILRLGEAHIDCRYRPHIESLNPWVEMLTTGKKKVCTTRQS
jgi:hypothetical protein